MFGTLQDRLVKELALAGIQDVETANRWIKETYLPDHNARFRHPAALPESGFVAVERSRLVETLCIEEERQVGRDNTISWNGRRLQIPESPLRRHYVGATVKVHAYPDGTLAILHGPRPIARYASDGTPVIVGASPGRGTDTHAAVGSVASRSVPSRRGLSAAEHEEKTEQRPALTGPSRDAKKPPSRKAKRCSA